MQIQPKASSLPGGQSGVAGAVSPSSPAAAKAQAKLKAVCKDMEALFLNMLLTQMRQTVPKDDLVSDGSKQDVMQSMLDTEMTKKMAGNSGVGLADMLYKQLSLEQQSIPAAKAVKAIKEGQASS